MLREGWGLHSGRGHRWGVGAFQSAGAGSRQAEALGVWAAEGAGFEAPPLPGPRWSPSQPQHLLGGLGLLCGAEETAFTMARVMMDRPGLEGAGREDCRAGGAEGRALGRRQGGGWSCHGRWGGKPASLERALLLQGNPRIPG